MMTLVVLVGALVPINAEALYVPTGPLAAGPCPSLPGCLYYNIGADLTGAPLDIDPIAFHYSDQAWKEMGLAQQAELWNDQALGANRSVFEFTIDGPGGPFGNVLGDATQPCSSPCELRLDILADTQWNTQAGGGTIQPGWIDMRSIVTHEFGHWFGIDHSGVLPDSDANQEPTLWTPYARGTDHWRTIQQDDINALRVARPTTPNRNMLSNGHWSYTAAQWGGGAGCPCPALSGTTWGAASEGWGASYQRLQSGSDWYLRLAGTGANVFQDVFVGDSYIKGWPLRPRMRFRSVSGSGSLTVAVWPMDVGGDPIYLRTCNFAAGSSWKELTGSSCSGSLDFNEPTNSVRMRYQVYRNSGTVDIDHLRLEFCNASTPVC